MEMEDDLRKLKLPKDKDPKELLADMAAFEVQYKCRITDIRKVAVVLRAGTRHYAVTMTMSSTLTTYSHSRK